MSISTALSTPFASWPLLKAFLPQPQPVTVQRQAVAVDNVAFHHALVALAAKLAAVDGAPNAAETAVFTTLFGGENVPQAKSLFAKHVADHSSALQYARQIMNVTCGRGTLHSELLERLLSLATADGTINAAEHEMLRAVAGVFQITGDAFKALVGRHVVPAGSPYQVLGIAASASDEALRAHYMAQVQRLHPDRYQAAGASRETVAMLSDQLAALRAWARQAGPCHTMPKRSLKLVADARSRPIATYSWNAM